MYDKLIRSKRKTLGLEITPSAEIILRAPEQAKDSDIEKFLKKSVRWIQRHKEKVLRQIQETPKKQYVEGETFLYLGREHLLPREREGKRTLLAWYKKEARRVFEERVGIYARLDNTSFKRVRVTSARRRWGSCSKDSLNFTWRLILAPIEIIDYIVVHEVAHLTHKNHKKRFRVKVKKLYPNDKWAKAWLKQNGHMLNV